MNTVVSKITMDLQYQDKMPVIYAVQGEKSARSVALTLLCGGEAWQIPEDLFVAVRYSKPDRTCGYYDTMPDGSSAWACSENVITILLTPQMLTTAGSVLAQVEMQQGEQLLATFSFHLLVEANPAAGVMVSETYVNWLQWMTEEFQKYAAEMAARGEFVGPHYTPAVDEAGNLSWTNNGGLENPAEQNIRGPKGDSPVKGTDYYTQEDVDQIIAGVLSQIPVAEGVSY